MAAENVVNCATPTLLPVIVEASCEVVLLCNVQVADDVPLSFEVPLLLHRFVPSQVGVGSTIKTEPLLF